ncbi:hypothetical protein [Pedobacter nototheniae]|uniref:hypothetical protein n=1 Tax=Pedobacter nototheniae TaxID=2488994 RepID=UPI00292DF448|nr:hypothetical protein [Pedobacter nototheniae]
MIGRILLFCFFSFVLLSCNTKESIVGKPPITDSNKEKITAENSSQNQIKAIKRYADEPLYYIYVNHEQCFFQVLINDIPVFHYFEDGGIMTPIILNNYINHSGKQIITYRLYPQTKRTYGEGFNILTPYTKFDVKLYVRNNADTANSFDKQKLLLTHHAATKADGKSFIGDGKDYYEYSFAFEAKVPFELKGWEESKDLSKIEPKVLLAKTEAAYQYYYNIIKNKQIETYYRLTFANTIAQIKSEYWDVDDIKEGENEDQAFLKDATFKLEPLENYKLQLYANGKVACLEQTSNDLRLKKESSIWGKSKNEKGGTEATFIKLYLYIPKGKDTFEIL